MAAVKKGAAVTRDVEGLAEMPRSDPFVMPWFIPVKLLAPDQMLKTIGLFGAALYGLNEWKVFHAILHSPRVDHNAMKVTVAIGLGKFARRPFYSGCPCFNFRK